MLRVSRLSLPILATSVVLAAGCGDDGGSSSATEGGSESSGDTSSTTTAALTTSSTSTSTSSSTGAASTDMSSSGSDSGSSSSSGPSGSSSTGVASNCDDVPVLGEDFSYIWVSNSQEGTISKINTQTLVEEGRYLARPDGGGSPSRTSVNLNGDAAVASRSGGITVFHARMEDCADPANTSSGPEDVKAWPDGCMAWHTPFNYSTQRPVAWTEGEYSEETCRYENTRLWTSGAATSASPVEFLLLDGETGAVEATAPTEVGAGTFGAYGGAVDSEGNFWSSMLSGQVLFKVNLDDLSVEQWSAPSGYGIAVDAQGRSWTCQSQLSRFSPDTETWDSASVGSQGGGCAVDANNTLWVAGTGNRLIGIDVETFDILHDFSIPGYAKGVSIDFDGSIWAVSQATDAWRVDPTNGSVQTFTGLTNPYTYSDMTGFALALQSRR